MPSPQDSADPANARPKSYLIAAGTASYDHLPEDRQLPSVEDDLRRIVRLFQDSLGYERVLAGLGEDPQYADFSRKLSGWLKARERKPSDRIVFYYSGHGVVDGGEHYLMVADSKESNVAGTAFLTAQLGRMLHGTSIRQMMVILDTCHAGAGSGDFGVIAERYVKSIKFDCAESCGFYSLAAARPKEEAKEGVFSVAFDRVVRDPPPACGGARQEYLSSYEHLVEAINKDFETRKLHQRASINSLAVQSAPLFINNLRYRREPEEVVSGGRPGLAIEAAHSSRQRQEHRDKLRVALSAGLDRFFEDPKRDPGEFALALEIKDLPSGREKIRETIVDRLLDWDRSIPVLNKQIRKLAEQEARAAVKILENCMDLILPFHFAPHVVARASSCLNAKGGGFLKGVVMTRCGAELVMAALDQFESRFDPKDPELGGRHALVRGLPPLGKIGIDDDARRFLANLLDTESEMSRAERLAWDKLDTERTTYCIVRLPQENAEEDYVVKLLERVSELQPELPILLLTAEGQARDPEGEYFRVLRRRFEEPRR